MEISINGMMLNVVEIVAILGLTYATVLLYITASKNKK